MPMMTSEILKSVNFSKTQKSRYLENKRLLFLQIKKFINYTSRAILWQKIVLQRRKSLANSLTLFFYKDFKQLQTQYS